MQCCTGEKSLLYLSFNKPVSCFAVYAYRVYLK